MFLARLIILLLIVAALLWLLKRIFSPAPEPEKLASKASETMRKCQHCGLHVPESAAVISQKQFYCSQEHADLEH